MTTIPDLPEWARVMTGDAFTANLAAETQRLIAAGITPETHHQFFAYPLAPDDTPGPERWETPTPEGARFLELPAVLALGPERAQMIVPGREKATEKPANPGWAWHKLEANAKPDPDEIDCDDDGDTHKPPPKVPKEPADESAIDEARLAVLRDYYCRNHKRPIFSPLADMNGTLLQQ
jgi:hypothetical protein